ncbi:M48 family metalloprotease [Salipiger mucosus]|uniref:Peptidase, M48 family n=1 Tax=Salipiger mucosus DSM 16094 TaxID=1123237 RepID=S9QWE9_9RHOB|nr:M48 family metalloprotease [Salipiger mucosus]EPX83927.1 Peptidase, M48 family [Salipiger mucosus DSM 16094]
MNLSILKKSGPGVIAAFALGLLAACGTTYDLPEASEGHASAAQAMFAEEQNPATAKSGRKLSGTLSTRQFRRVVSRVEPVAERFCRQETAEQENFNCDILIRIDRSFPGKNAYQTYDDAGRPVVAFTPAMIQDARNPDELAFVLGHEMGHHIGQHQHKQQQQAMAGALIMGAMTAYGQAQANAANPYRYRGGEQRALQNSMDAGAGIGKMAYSQTYELESDVIGTAITRAAGYDPVKGARFFARPEEKRLGNGALSFWGTHPPDEKRLATVLATMESIEATGGLARKKTSDGQ